MFQSIIKKLYGVIWKENNGDNSVSSSFNISSEPAVAYFQNLGNIDFALLGLQEELLETMQKEIINILKEWVRNGKSYTQIAKEIHLVNPSIFPKPIAKSIAIIEVGRAYWWANHEPAIELEKQGYEMVKRWTTSHDNKVCLDCLANEAVGNIPLNDPFPGTGDQFAPSKKCKECRCSSTHTIVGIK